MPDLVVISPFDGREVGERIVSANEVAAIEADHRAAFVVRVESEPGAPIVTEPHTDEGH